MKEIRIDENGAGKRLDKFLGRVLAGAPKSLLYAQLRKKNITLNARKAVGSEILTEGDRVQCFFSDETWEKFLHPGLKSDPGSDRLSDEAAACYRKHPEIRILHEDADLLIAEKPAGLLTQRAKPGDESLNDWLIGYLLHNDRTDPASLAVFRPSAAHRLDRNTGGIVIMTLSLKAAQVIAALLREHRVGKYYLAVLHGRLCEPMRMRSLHDKEERNNLVRIRDLKTVTEEDIRSGVPEAIQDWDQTGADDDRSDPAMTVFAPVSCDPATDTTLVLAGLRTGKAHQLRAQFAALGHPIVGDPKYGGSRTSADDKKYHTSGQLLHAAYLSFPDGLTDLPGMSGKAFYSDPMKRGDGREEADRWRFFADRYAVNEEKIRETIRNHEEVMRL